MYVKWNVKLLVAEDIKKRNKKFHSGFKVGGPFKDIARHHSGRMPQLCDGSN